MDFFAYIVFFAAPWLALALIFAAGMIALAALFELLLWLFGSREK